MIITLAVTFILVLNGYQIRYCFPILLNRRSLYCIILLLVHLSLSEHRSYSIQIGIRALQTHRFVLLLIKGLKLLRIPRHSLIL